MWVGEPAAPRSVPPRRFHPCTPRARLPPARPRRVPGLLLLLLLLLSPSRGQDAAERTLGGCLRGARLLESCWWAPLLKLQAGSKTRRALRTR